MIAQQVRLLGRYGFIMTFLISEPKSFDVNKAELDRILAGFKYEEGKKYAEYVKGDKLAGYGLAALVGGGAGAVA